MLYFAYGSNLDADQMKRRCPSSRFVDIGRLENHALTFSGYSARWRGAVATIVKHRGAATPGVLYSLEPEDLDALDSFEGHPFAYRRCRKMVRDSDDRRVLAHVYVLGRPDPVPPGVEYFRTIQSAYRRLGFDRAALERAVFSASKTFQRRTVLS